MRLFGDLPSFFFPSSFGPEYSPAEIKDFEEKYGVGSYHVYDKVMRGFKWEDYDKLLEFMRSWHGMTDYHKEKQKKFIKDIMASYGYKPLF